MGEHSQAALLLRKQLAELNKNPVEGFSAGLIDDDDIFRWEVGNYEEWIQTSNNNSLEQKWAAILNVEPFVQFHNLYAP